MNALSVASAVKSTTFTVPSSADPKITPFAVILKLLLALAPVAPTISASALLTLSNTPIASSARYSTAVATITTISSTNDTANENFMTDQGSMRLMYRRARRGPRPAATVARAPRTASLTRAAPLTEIGVVAPPGVRALTVAVPRAAPGRAAPIGGALVGMSDGSGGAETGCVGSRASGGGAIPGARANFGTDVADSPDDPSPGTVARPMTEARPVATPPSSAATGFVSDSVWPRLAGASAVPDFAWVAVSTY